MRLGPIPPRKKADTPTHETQVLSQIPEGGEGDRGQMPGVPPPLGLTLIDALRSLELVRSLTHRFGRSEEFSWP